MTLPEYIINNRYLITVIDTHSIKNSASFVVKYPIYLSSIIMPKLPKHIIARATNESSNMTGSDIAVNRLAISGSIITSMHLNINFDCRYRLIGSRH